MTTRKIPEGYEALTPYLVVKDAAKAIDFYTKVFGARETMRMPGPDGKIGHAELKIGAGHVMLADEMPQMGCFAPASDDRMSISLLVYVDDVDAVFKRAIDAGARQTRPVENQFYGDRSGMLADPFGHIWNIATHVEDVAPEELKKRMQEMMKNKAKG